MSSLRGRERTMRAVRRVSAAGSSPTDSSEERLPKSTLVLSSLLMPASRSRARNHAEALARLALAMRDALAELPSTPEFELRIGIDSGPVVAGVIGRSSSATTCGATPSTPRAGWSRTRRRARSGHRADVLPAHRELRARAAGADRRQGQGRDDDVPPAARARPVSGSARAGRGSLRWDVWDPERAARRRSEVE